MKGKEQREGEMERRARLGGWREGQKGRRGGGEGGREGGGVGTRHSATGSSELKGQTACELSIH